MPSGSSADVAQFETLRLIMLGRLPVVRAGITQLHQRGYAEPNDWSKPLPTGRAGEVMAILTKRMRVVE
ncbi:MAG: hypothetical protein F6J97_20825 [Leptolyngbya sp. SIO4C1]|nr:hypothetical protein [Leptolyngbya sp. SIO4C1]